MEQTKVMREEAELERNNARISVLSSVWLSTYIGDVDGEAYYKVALTNKGLGPAVIERFDVSYQDQPVYNWDELARRMAAQVGSDKSFEGNYLRSYCSLYSDCFRTELFKRPQAVESCESSEKPFVSHGFFKDQ